MNNKKYLAKIIAKDPNGIQVISACCSEAKVKANEIKPILLEQLYKPVRWIDSVKEMQLLGVTKIIECGPGKVLCGLIKRIETSFELFSMHDQISINNTSQ